MCLKRACDVVTTFAVAGNWLFYAFFGVSVTETLADFLPKTCISLVKFHEIYKDIANILYLILEIRRCLIISIRLIFAGIHLHTTIDQYCMQLSDLLKSPGGQGRFTIAR